MLDGILSRQHHERPRQLISLLLDGYLSFGHGFQQGRLSLRGRAVDFVGQYDVGEDRSGFELERARPLIEDFKTGDVRGQHVGCELNALKRTVEAARQRVPKRSLAYTGNVFDQQMPARQECHESKLDYIRLAANNTLDC